MCCWCKGEIKNVKEYYNVGVISDVGISLISLVLKILSFLKWNLRVAEHG
jgi:hypothetical protein